MNLMRARTKTPTTVQRERIQEAPAVQQEADQEGRDVDGAAQVPDVGRQTRPRKPPDAECLNLKKIVPVMLKTGFMLMLLMLMMINPILIMKKTGTLMKTRSVMMYPMMMISGPVLMETYGDDNESHDIEDEFVYTEEESKGDVGLYYRRAV